MSVRVTKDRTAAFKRAIEALVKHQVLVGVPADSAARGPDPGNPEPINSAALAYIHDTGSPAANIPARPFMRPGIEDAKPQIIRRLKSATTAALDGDASAVDKGLHAVGLAAASSIKNKIQSGPFEPLKPATVHRRKTRKKAPRDSDAPLIDTGAMRDAIKYVIAPKGSKT